MLQPLAKGGCRESIGERSKIKKSSAQEKEPGSRRLQETPSSAEELLVWAFDLDFKLDVLLFNLAGGLSHRKLREGNWRTPCLELAIAANEVATSRKQHERGKSLATPHPGTRDALEDRQAPLLQWKNAEETLSGEPCRSCCPIRWTPISAQQPSFSEQHPMFKEAESFPATPSAQPGIHLQGCVCLCPCSYP
ncbi:uncharacterized protein LOC120400293 isoform X5 [Mauremys reevesii]|uniref:uncharacterized protein LOC120400293 isoform X5 n=1 Tax=Mauremys reevesii TaxID=260615 RepID=UPI00193FE740|nr:uncharacterized protein LOC120400293 isoform X5 [Mauremys reevesii]